MRPTARPGRDRSPSPLRAHVGDVDVDAGVDVVEGIPAVVVGIFIDDEIVGAIPAPVGADGPIPGSDFKVESAGKPEAVKSGIKAFDAVAEGRANVLEAAVFEGMIDVKALIVGTCMAVPMVIVDVGSVVDVAGGVAFRLGLGARIVALGRRRRNAALIGARWILAALPVLGNSRQGHKNCQSKQSSWKNQASIHSLLLEHAQNRWMCRS
jgi:hypothetical protein